MEFQVLGTLIVFGLMLFDRPNIKKKLLHDQIDKIFILQSVSKAKFLKKITENRSPPRPSPCFCSMLPARAIDNGNNVQFVE